MLLLALNQDDYDAMRKIWDDNIMFGAYSWQDMDKIIPGNPNFTKYNGFLTSYPGIKAIMSVNLVKGYVGRE